MMQLWRVHNGQKYDEYVENLVLAETAGRAIELGGPYVREWDYGRTKGPLQAELVFGDMTSEKAEWPK